MGTGPTQYNKEESNMSGWKGQILRVNLTEGTSTVEPLNEEWAKEYVGGRGLGARYLYDCLLYTSDAADE